MQAVNTTLEGDINELRQIQNETIASKRPPGLPPAYGSLNEEDLAPYQLHKDSGALVVAALKQGARERFSRRLSELASLAHDDGSPLSIENTASAGVKTLYHSTVALYEATLSLDTALRSKHAIYSTDVRTMSGRNADRIPTQQCFVASRIANIILELGWLMVGLNEMRPKPRNFSPRTLSVLKIMYTQVDDVLVEALRQWNAESSFLGRIIRPDHQHSRLMEFQRYLSQFTALRGKIASLVYSSVHSWTVDLLGKSHQYLQDAVETERMQAANCYPATYPEPEEIAREAREASVISSEGMQSGTENDSGG